MIFVSICSLCQSKYRPEETLNASRLLKEFNGYTVDVRLEQFRKAQQHHGSIEFVDFSSTKGQRLLQKMHDELLRQIQEEVDTPD
jgi:Rod binding domain-containing protein